MVKKWKIQQKTYWELETQMHLKPVHLPRATTPAAAPATSAAAAAAVLVVVDDGGGS